MTGVEASTSSKDLGNHNKGHAYWTATCACHNQLVLEIVEKENIIREGQAWAFKGVPGLRRCHAGCSAAGVQSFAYRWLKEDTCVAKLARPAPTPCCRSPARSYNIDLLHPASQAMARQQADGINGDDALLR